MIITISKNFFFFLQKYRYINLVLHECPYFIPNFSEDWKTSKKLADQLNQLYGMIGSRSMLRQWTIKETTKICQNQSKTKRFVWFTRVAPFKHMNAVFPVQHLASFVPSVVDPNNQIFHQNYPPKTKKKEREEKRERTNGKIHIATYLGVQISRIVNIIYLFWLKFQQSFVKFINNYFSKRKNWKKIRVNSIG